MEAEGSGEEDVDVDEDDLEQVPVDDRTASLGVIRPGIVHRLDKGTSGTVILNCFIRHPPLVHQAPFFQILHRLDRTLNVQRARDRAMYVQ